MKVNTSYLYNLRKDSLTLLSTAGVLGETYIDIDSSQSKGPQAQDGDVLPSREMPDFRDMVRAGQGTLQNMDALIKRLDRIVAFVESGQGSIGKAHYTIPALYNRLNTTVTEFQGLVNQVAQGKGTLGKLLVDDELYQQSEHYRDKLNVVIDDINAGKGTAGKFLKDPALYDNANKTIANVKKLTDDINAGKGAIGNAGERRRICRQAARYHEQALRHLRSAGRRRRLSRQTSARSGPLRQCQPNAS